jgi:hypothetical protein
VKLKSSRHAAARGGTRQCSTVTELSQGSRGDRIAATRPMRYPSTVPRQGRRQEEVDSVIRRAVVSVLFAAALLPAVARAQDPLRTWCSSPTMDYCVSVLSFTWYVELAPPLWVQGVTDATVELFGSGLAAAPLHHFEAAGNGATAITWGTYGHASPQEAGIHAMHENDIYDMSLYDDPPEMIDFFSVLTFAGMDNAVSRCATVQSETLERCVTVPEPGSLLLIATAIIGLGFVAWRSRRAVMGS